ncbi:MAG: hypothetical protein ACTSXK_05135 [Promethearchaeota archaeon]
MNVFLALCFAQHFSLHCEDRVQNTNLQFAEGVQNINLGVMNTYFLICNYNSII